MSARVRLSLKEKIEIIKSCTCRKISVRQLASQFKIGKTQVSKILNNKKELLEEWEKYGNNIPYKFKFPRSPGLIIDQVMYDWFCEAQEANVQITGSILREKALEVAQYLNLKGFKASSGWLDRFKARHNISFKAPCEVTHKTYTKVLNEWSEKLNNISCIYNQKDIYNCDETGLFFCALPGDTVSLKNMSCNKGELSNERLTILLCTNMLGEFEPSLVIGNSQFSEGTCFRLLNIDWQSDSKAWINETIFHQWLTHLNDKMTNQKRNIVIFMDAAASLPHLSFSNINIIFWPSNASSVDHPLKSGIIKSFKVNYRSCALAHLLANLEASNEKGKNISVLHALQWISSSVTNIPKETVFECFKMSGLSKPLVETPSSEVPKAVNSEGPTHVNRISDFLTSNCESNDKIQSYLDIDAEVTTKHSPLEISDIQESNNSGEKTECQEMKTQLEDESLMKLKEALTVLNRLKHMFSSQEDFEALSLITSLQANVENKILSQKEVQTELRNLFV